MDRTKKTGVSVVIPSYNCKKILFRLLDSLKKSNYSKFEVIVVDNGSIDETLGEGRKNYKWVRWIDAGEKNIGQTGAYNLGFSYANKKNHILMIDADVVPDSGMITKLVERLESDSQIGIATPMILYLNDKNWVNQAGSEVNLLTGKVTIGWGPKRNFLKAKEVQGSGTVMLFRRELVDKIGGFENWFLCYFDPEYCVRAKKAGYSIWYEPMAVCYHDQSKDPKVWRPRVLSRAYLLGRNRTLFIRKHGNIFTYSLFLPFILGYYLIEAYKFRIIPKWFELIKGSFEGYNYPLRKSIKIPLSR
ncbi:hypothetical protein A2210_00565 [Candidatus Woesebacteria bacterium RIFOXYA1_FULL_40_18]|uniref:Glycosyltransferase 2-like domain-containing protein n=1 Tax=Candidatus Woesebacteria bacterium RIFOXYA1_FULL_40_18 TaxID=1802532 RepID=A0A1F8CKK8_9BACT|nr:MAG: hypothetical protein A2210_00565 [Candidatus Woesebacteria bacterium RIFOXYA1_FULL_40_18]